MPERGACEEGWIFRLNIKEDTSRVPFRPILCVRACIHDLGEEEKLVVLSIDRSIDRSYTSATFSHVRALTQTVTWSQNRNESRTS